VSSNVSAANDRAVLTETEIIQILTCMGENTGISTIRPGQFPATEFLALKEKLRGMISDRPA
jgi:hypothetical protein